MCYEYMIKIFAAVSFLNIYIVPLIHQNRLNLENRYNTVLNARTPKMYLYLVIK